MLHDANDILNSNIRDVCGKQKPERAMTLPNCFQSHICECFNSYSSKITMYMNKNSVKYLQGINFFVINSLQEDYNEELRSWKTCLFITQSYSRRKQKYV